MPIAVALLVFVTVGAPVLIFWHLRRNAHLLHDKRFRSRWGIFFECYVDRHYYWQSIVLLRRALFIFVALSFQSDQYRLQMTVYQYLALIVLMVQSLWRPMRHRLSNQVETLVQLCVVALTVLMGGSTDGTFDGVTEVALVLFVCLPTLAIAILIIRTALLHRRDGAGHAKHLTQPESRRHTLQVGRDSMAVHNGKVHGKGGNMTLAVGLQTRKKDAPGVAVDDANNNDDDDDVSVESELSSRSDMSDSDNENLARWHTGLESEQTSTDATQHDDSVSVRNSIVPGMGNGPTTVLPPLVETVSEAAPLLSPTPTPTPAPVAVAASSSESATVGPDKTSAVAASQSGVSIANDIADDDRHDDDADNEGGAQGPGIVWTPPVSLPLTLPPFAQTGLYRDIRQLPPHLQHAIDNDGANPNSSEDQASLLTHDHLSSPV
jgi:hypothetical protein